MKKTMFLSISFMILCFAKVKIIGVEIPGLHQKDGMGVYDLIL